MAVNEPPPSIAPAGDAVCQALKRRWRGYPIELVEFSVKISDRGNRCHGAKGRSVCDHQEML